MEITLFNRHLLNPRFDSSLINLHCIVFLFCLHVLFRILVSVLFFEFSSFLEQGTLHAALVQAISPHLPALRNSPYGKKILSRNSLKK